MDEQSSAGSLAADMADTARALHVASDANLGAAAILEAALRYLDGFDHVGISLLWRGGRIATAAATSDLVWDLDQMQYDLAEGPCLDAARSADPGDVMCFQQGDVGPWPTYVGHASARGVRSQLGVQLHTGVRSLGSLNLYSTTDATVDAQTVRLAVALATHAALALHHLRTTSGLLGAMENRELIGVATGMVMQRYRVSRERAVSFLVRASSVRNVRLEAIAAEVVGDVAHRPSSGVEPS